MKLACDTVKQSSEVTCIEQNPKDSSKIAVGYLDGSLRIFDLNQRNSSADQIDQSIVSVLTFNGHKTAITSIRFDRDGVRLVSGSKDTDLVIWDLVGECGLFRLKGHKAPITNAIFMHKQNVLISR